MEDYNVEYKIDIPTKTNKLKAEIVSFLNSEGGEICLGVRDDGSVDYKLTEEKNGSGKKYCRIGLQMFLARILSI